MRAGLWAAVVAGTLVVVVLGAGGPGPPDVFPVRVSACGGVPRVASAVAVGRGRALTVAHVLAARAGVWVVVDGRARRARVLRVDARADLALLAVPGLDAPPLRTGRAGRVLRVARADGGARPATLRRRVTVRVSAPGVPAGARPALELAAAVEPGDSGAPVVGAGERVAGFVFARAANRPDRAWAVDAVAAAPLLRR